MHFYKQLYVLLTAIGNSLKSPLLLLLRLCWGGAFFYSGLWKFGHIDSTIQYFTSLGLPIPAFNAYFVSLIELLGGACLFLGLGSRLAALILVVDMIVAYMTAEPEAVRTLFSNPLLFTQKTPFSFLFASLMIFVFGPGAISIDRYLEKNVFKQTGEPR